ncbi:MAG: hemolysin III family protein [Peptococcaceae bacterium]|nr:hemolysin III family protein [Peptococcaceae bacterium]
MYLRVREPVNSLTHLLGAVLSIAGLVFLLFKSVEAGSMIHLFSAAVFGLSLLFLYSSSSIYHWVVSSTEVIRTLRKIDHCMIYVLIAGTYTPVCLLTLKGKLGIGLLIAIWSLTVLGIILKLIWFDAPRWLYTGFYLLLGWLAVFFIYPISQALPGKGVFMLVFGGILYSAGSVFYALKPKRLKLWKFGFHEIFHLFILAGSIAHYIFVYNYVLG